MISAKNISKTYTLKQKQKGFKLPQKKSINAVKGVSIDIMKGKIIGLLGVNGAGKTTTIKMLSGLLSPDNGNIIIDDIIVQPGEKSIKNKVNIITGGERNLYWRLSAYENLEYFGTLYGINKKELTRRIPVLLDKVGLTGEENIPVERFSKGMKQRLQIAKGLINNPDYIFLDEPTLGLDINIAKKMRTYIRQLATEDNKGLLLTTHYIREAEELCDYIYVIDKGSIIKEGTPEELKRILTNDTETKIDFENLDESLIESVRAICLDLNIEVSIHEKSIVMKNGEGALSEILSEINKNNCLLIGMNVEQTTLEDALLNSIYKEGQNNEGTMDNIS